MTSVDRWLQRWRIRKAAAFIPPGARVLDVGCADGALFRLLGDRLAGGVGIDGDLAGTQQSGSVRLVRGVFPDAIEGSQTFDAITMLAVLEHVPPERQRAVAEGCARHLRPAGRLIITTPSPLVDPIVGLLVRLRLAHGMDLEGHYGFDPRTTPAIFEPAGFDLERTQRFQLGLNTLFVFRRR